MITITSYYDYYADAPRCKRCRYLLWYCLCTQVSRMVLLAERREEVRVVVVPRVTRARQLRPQPRLVPRRVVAKAARHRSRQVRLYL